MPSIVKTAPSRLRLNSPHPRGKGLAVVVSCALVLSSCVSTTPNLDGVYAYPIGGAPVISNDTPYSDALFCLANTANEDQIVVPRIAVGAIPDYTGKLDVDGGNRVTQGATLMAISALAKSGVRLVERYSIGVPTQELNYASAKLLAGDNDNLYRPLTAGSIAGSDYFLVGGISELNYNIHSGGMEGLYDDTSAFAPKATGGENVYVMNVALDLRMVDSRTLEIVDVVSYQKQIVGWEYSAGVFAFLNKLHLLDVGASEKALEPIQLAVRASIERAALEMVARLYDINPRICSESYGTEKDPLGVISIRQEAALAPMRDSHERRVAHREAREERLRLFAAARESVETSALTEPLLASVDGNAGSHLNSGLRREATDSLRFATSAASSPLPAHQGEPLTIVASVRVPPAANADSHAVAGVAPTVGSRVRLGAARYAHLQAEALHGLRIPSPRSLLSLSWSNHDSSNSVLG